MKKTELQKVVDTIEALHIMGFPVMFGLYADDADLLNQRPEFKKGLYITERELVLAIIGGGHLELYDYTEEKDLINQVLVNYDIEYIRLNENKIVMVTDIKELKEVLYASRQTRQETILDGE